MQQQVTTHSSYETRPARPVVSPFALAKTYAARFAESGDVHMAFACIKHTANLVCLNPSLALNDDKVEITINASVAQMLPRLRERIALYLPGTTFAEVGVDHTVGVNIFTGSLFTPKVGDRNTITTARRKLIVALPKRALTKQALMNMLDVLFSYPADGVVETAFARTLSMEIADVIQATNERDQRVNSALSSLFDEVFEEVGWSRDHAEQLNFAIMTRHDGEFYEVVASCLTEFLGE